MTEQLPARVAETMLERLGGVADAAGRRLRIGKRPLSAVVGRVCDDEPLFNTEVSLGKNMPDRLVRGLGALGLLGGANRLILAVNRDEGDLVRLLEAEAAGTRIEVIGVPPRSPMDPESLVCDLAQIARRSVVAARLDHPLVLGAVGLVDVATALDGRFPVRRTVTVAGSVDRPAVVNAPLGTSMMDLVQACGGCQDPGWVPFHNGVLTGAQVSWDRAVDLDTRGVVVLPHDHPIVRRSTTPLAEQLARVASACVSCRICTDACSSHLNGSHLRPHLVMQAVAAAGLDTPPDPALSALECLGCNICSVRCPAMLRPAEVVQDLARRLARGGVSLTAATALRPREDRPGRRLSVDRLVDALGLAPLSRGLPVPIGHVIPDRVTLSLAGPTGSPRTVAVTPGQAVGMGDVVALGQAGSAEVDLRSPVSGVVVHVDADDGVVIQPR